MTRLATLFPLLPFLMATLAHATLIPGREPHDANPIVPGYYADPSLVQDTDGHSYIYATIDPWGGDTLGCWESTDFKNWTYRVLNWPTKKACTSPTSKPAKVWAPSVVRAPDGKFYMYISVGSEIWVGVAEHPLGPWRNALGDRPLVPSDYKPGYHMIDAEAFIDDDGQAYLYWGSGLNWVNGRCWAVKLKPDMTTFDGPVHDVTPGHYFEAPFMVKRHGVYFLMNSTGKTTERTYAVQYAVGTTPFGPFTDGPGTPILSSDPADNILSTGHHAIFHRDGHDYILYHRHSIPFDPRFIGRQLCVDEIHFTADGRIEKISPSNQGPDFIQGRDEARSLAAGALATASSSENAFTAPGCVLDDNYATRWTAAPGDRAPWLELDLGRPVPITTQALRFEYAWKLYAFTLKASTDHVHWTTLADHSANPASGSPVLVKAPALARYLRLVFTARPDTASPSLFEWSVF